MRRQSTQEKEFIMSTHNMVFSGENELILTSEHFSDNDCGRQSGHGNPGHNGIALNKIRL